MARSLCKITKAAALATALVIMAACFSLTAFAERRVSDIFNLDSRANMAVSVYYDVEEPSVSILKPNGRELDSREYTIERTSGAVCYYIPDAATGQWSIDYEKGRNSTLDVKWGPYVSSVSVGRFDFEPHEDARYMNVNFSVQSPEDGRVSCVFYAAVLDGEGNVSGKKRLSSGTYRVNEEHTVRVAIDGLESYDNYRFYMEAMSSEYGLTAKATAVTANTFRVSKQSEYDAIENVKASFDMSNGVLSLDWEEYRPSSCDRYVIALFDANGASDPFYTNTQPRGSASTAVTVDSNIKKVRVELSYIRNNRTSKMLKKEIPLDGALKLTLPDSGYTSSQQISASYTANSPVSATLSINGREQNLKLDGSGSFGIPLSESENNIIIKYETEGGLTAYTASRRFFLDAVPPSLVLPEHDATIYVDAASFDVAGVTEPDCAVTINGEPTDVNSDGTFLKTVMLGGNENEFVINSRDPAGNITSQTIVIRKPGSGVVVDETGGGFSITSILPLIISLVGGACFAALVFIFSNSYKKRLAAGAEKNEATRTTLRALSFTLAAIALAVAIFAAVNFFILRGNIYSEKIFETVDGSEKLPEAVEMINNYKMFEGLFIAMLITFAVLLGAGIVLGLLPKMKQKSAERKAAQAAQQAAYYAGQPGQYAQPYNGMPGQYAQTPFVQPMPTQYEQQPVQQYEQPPIQPYEQPPVQQYEQPVQQLKRFCPSCGKAQEAGMIFCDNCGTKLE